MSASIPHRLHADPRKSYPIALLDSMASASKTGQGRKSARNNNPCNLSAPARAPRRHSSANESEWASYTCEFLVTHVLRKQHAEIRQEILQLQQFAADAGHAEADAIGRVLAQLGRELAAHIAEEEDIFPTVLDLELAYVGMDCTSASPQRIGSNLESIAQHHRQHSRHLDQLRTEANLLASHPDAALRELADRLLRLRGALLSHFHLEDQVLLPRVACMETQLFGSR